MIRRSASRPVGDVPAPAGRAGSRSSWRRREDTRWAWILIAPTSLGLLVFYLWPVIRTCMLSFTASGPFGGGDFTGFDNYTQLLSDPALHEALINTFKYTAIALLGIPLALVIAALMNTEGLAGSKVYRVIYFLPVVTMPVAVGLVWRSLYRGDGGIINHVLSYVGINGTDWLTNSTTALPAIAVVGVWMGLGTQIVILLAGIQGVPKDLYEAASLDGAGKIRQFFSVTVPCISPSVFFLSVLCVIGALQTFDLIYVMSDATNPAHPQTRTIVAYFYRKGFVDNEQGYAAAVAMVLLVIIGAMTALQFWGQKKWVHYE